MFAALLAVIAVLAITAVVAVPLAIIRGYVLSVLWGWFFVPLGVPVIHIAAAIGIALTAGFLFEGLHKDEEKSEHPIRDIVVGYLSPFVALGIGYLVHSFQ